MKKSCLVAVLAAVVTWMAFGVNRAAAQSAPYRPAAGASPIAVVDVNYIFHHHPRFKLQMEEMKGDFERLKQEYRKEMEGLAKMAENVQNYRPGTPEYKGAEEELYRKRSDLDARMMLSQKEFKQRDAKIRYNTYQEILQEVQYYCQASGVAMVVNFNGDRINPENTDEVLGRIYQYVVFAHKDLDITPHILRRLAPETANRPAGPMGVVAPPR